MTLRICTAVVLGVLFASVRPAMAQATCTTSGTTTTCTFSFATPSGGGGSSSDPSWTASGNNISNLNTGNVSIGTATPSFPDGGSGLAISRTGINTELALTRTDAETAGSLSLTAASGQNEIYSTGNKPLKIGVNSGWAMTIDGSRNVGIGTVTPVYKLHVIGNAYVDGNISARYQDVAEWVRAKHPLDAGTVVVVGKGETNFVETSHRSYDTAVVGVVSAQPGLALGEAGDDKVLVAQSGRVRVKVDASYGAVREGDLLVTSPKPGVAMRSTAVNVAGTTFHRPGTLLGKALESLESGQREILVLLTLQ